VQPLDHNTAVKPSGNILKVKFKNTQNKKRTENTKLYDD